MALRRPLKLRVPRKAPKKLRRDVSKIEAGVKALAQDVGRTPRKPFGSAPSGRPKGGRLQKQDVNSLQYFDATLPPHLALPRPVGPYAVIRTTELFDSTASFMMFAFLASDHGSTNTEVEWLAACGVSSVAAGTSINGANNTSLIPMVGLDTLGNSAVICPAALTVQVMNGNALQTTSGIIAGGIATTQNILGGDSRTWAAVASQFISYMSPRMLSAGKLALKAVRGSSYPLDMSDASSFRTVRPYSSIGTTFTWNGDAVRPSGFAPICVWNVDGVNLTYMVTMEWRVRFDPANPASAAHTHHPMAKMETWEKVIKQATRLGNGIVDVAETVDRVASRFGTGVDRAFGLTD